MTADHTQQQTHEQQNVARELSLASTRPPGDVPGYDAEQLLGRGAYGEVWVGTDKNTGRRVAIKFYAHRGGIDWTLLSREVEKLVYLSTDRYVVQLLDVGWDAEPPYYVMEFIENGSLDDCLQQQGPLLVSDAAEIFAEVAVGLMHAHGKGVLHCDLKPANILLDQDHKPRLADFGQSRLSHEQQPSLGTLFYMAPEQADLNAMPDARWDVYALGAILYCMLTGSPPFRSDENVKRIESADGLKDRLAHYQSAIRSSPTPTDHRRVPGIDRALIDIVDRCLAVDPERRFPNVQSVIDALNARDVAKVRLPLMFLGFVGPILLFIIMALFGLRGYEGSVSESQDAITRLARQSNRFAAKFAARSIEGEIHRYFRAIEHEAEQPKLRELFTPVAASELVQQLDVSTNTSEDVMDVRPEFVEDEQRQRLHDYLQDRLGLYQELFQRDPRELKLASMFVVAKSGRMLAVAYDRRSTVNRSVGWNYSYRTYFHGEDTDKADNQIEWQDSAPHDIVPVRETHFSAAFQSTTTGIWKVAVSTPIFKDATKEEVIGVLALTVNLGDFASLRTNYGPDRFAVLIDQREGANKGVILQHPLLARMTSADGERATPFRLAREQLERIQSDATYSYKDPLAEAVGEDAISGEWIPAVEWVRLPEGPVERNAMIVLIQERYSKATEPVRQLGSKLKREGIWALVGVIAVVMVLWYVVLRVLSEPRLKMRRGVAAPSASQSTPVHNLTTLAAQPRQRD